MARNLTDVLLLQAPAFPDAGSCTGAGLVVDADLQNVLGGLLDLQTSVSNTAAVSECTSN